MKTIWDPTAKESLRQIARYINTRFGREARRDFMKTVRDTEKILKENPNLGVIDPLFANRRFTYHSIVINGLSKMVYYLEGDVIYVAAFWDTRQEPEQQADRVN